MSIQAIQQCLNTYDAVIIGLTGIDSGAFFTYQQKIDGLLPQLVSIAFSCFRDSVKTSSDHVCQIVFGKHPADDGDLKSIKDEMKLVITEVFTTTFTPGGVSKGEIDFTLVAQVRGHRSTTYI